MAIDRSEQRRVGRSFSGARAGGLEFELAAWLVWVVAT
jgi:hypothetical protein